jgi:hypothetical protein
MSIWDDLGDICIFWRSMAPNRLNFCFMFSKFCNYLPFSNKAYHIWYYVNLGRFRWYFHVLAKYISKSSQFLFNANSLSCYNECITCLIIRLYFVIYAITDLKATKCFTYGVKTYNIHNCITHMSIWDDSSEIYMFWWNKAPNLLNFTFIGIRCLFMMNASIVSLFDYISQ